MRFVVFVYSKVESFARCCTAMGEAEDKIVAQVFFVIGASIMLDFFFFLICLIGCC